MHLGTKVLTTGAGALQNFTPIKAIHAHLCAFHAYGHDFTRQVEAHHYCTHLNEEVRQCVIYDTDQPGARLIGVEYVISRRLFETLPMEERKYWHSHNFEVGGGLLTMPRIPTPVEDQEMQKLADTYGKTWHMWQIDRGDELPLGPPQLMMSYTNEKQVDWDMVARRDARYGYDTKQIGKHRQEKLKLPEKEAEGADYPIHNDSAWQVKMEQVKKTMPKL
jgi:hypothetical protein